MAADKTDNDREGLASEYALGTLSPGEKRQAERLIQTDPSFRYAVNAWQNRLAPLLAAVPPVEPPAGAFIRILRKIDEQSYSRKQSAGDTSPVDRSVRFWRRTAIAASLVAACLLSAFVFREVTRPVSGESFVAVLEADDRNPAFVASVDLRKGVVSVVRLGTGPQQGKSYELWAVGGGRQAPESLGLVNDSRDILVKGVSRVEPALLQQTTFAVSLEPAGGSPTGQPTGAILYTGKLVPLKKK